MTRCCGWGCPDVGLGWAPRCMRCITSVIGPKSAWAPACKISSLSACLRMLGLWVISTSGGREKAQAMFDSYRLCAEFLGLDFQTPLWGKGGAPGTVLTDAEALTDAARHFGPRAE